MWEEAPALLASLDALRVAVTIFDSRDRLVYANAHLNYLLRSLPPQQTLIGKSYEELVRLEVEGGEIAPSALAQGLPVFIARRLAQLRDGAWAPCDVALADQRVMEIKARRTSAGATVLLWTDVTAARAHMARLEEAVALSAEAFAFFDRRDRLIMGNELYAQLCGVKALDELMGKTFPEIAALVAWSGRIVLDETPQALAGTPHQGPPPAGGRGDAEDQQRRMLPGARPRHPRWRPGHRLHRHHRQSAGRNRAGPSSRACWRKPASGPRSRAPISPTSPPGWTRPAPRWTAPRPRCCAPWAMN